MFLASLSRGLARHLHLACLALTAATAAVFAQTNTPTAADGFDPNVDGNVYAMLTQGDGKLLIVGQFQNVQPNGGVASAHANIARLNADGSLDNSFNPAVNGAVRAVALDSKGRIVIGGDFTQVDGVARNYVARLNGDGSLDTTFSPGVGPSIVSSYPKLTSQVFAVAVQPDDHVIVGGSFNSATPSNSTTAVTRNNLVRFDATGAIDPFDANPNAAVRAVAVDAQGRILIGGGFTAVGPTGATTTRNRIARLNADGTVDATFDPNADNAIAAIAVQIDGKIVIGGYFTTLQPPSESAVVTASHLARLNSDGSIDHTFAPSVGGNVVAVALASDGGVLIGGDFTQIYTAGGISYSRGYAAKLTGTGDVDANFNPAVNAEVDAFAQQQDGKVVIGGYFTRAQPAGLSAAVVRNHLARILVDGALDTAFQVDAGGRILAEVTQTDNKIVVAGSFTNIGGSNRYYIARLNPDGTLDTSYNPTLNAPAYALAYDSTKNQVLVGGAFTTVGPFASPTPRNHIARLNADGSVDSSFDPDLDGAVGAIVLQKDGNILVGGTFTAANPGNSGTTTSTSTTTTTTTAVTRAYLLRLTTAGQLDTTFNPNPNAAVAAIGLQSDAKIVIGGAFTTLDPGATGSHVSTRLHLARLNTDGTVDSAYGIHANANVDAIVIQSDDKAIIGGDFTQLFPQNATSATVRNHIARLNKDGSIDTAFDPNANGSVLALALQSDGKILVGGAFTIFQPAGDANWTQDRYVGRLTTDGKVDTAFNLDMQELFGSRVDSISVQPSGDILIGGTFTSVATTLTPSGPRVLRNHFVRVHADGTVDTAFDPGAGGAPTAVINAIAVQTNGKIVVGGSFNDLGGATSTNLAQFNQEGTPDYGFNAALTTDGPVNAIGVRAIGAVAQTQLGGFAWLNSNGSLRTTFTPGIRTSGQINAALPQSDGSVFLAGSFSDLTGSTGGNFVLLDKTGAAQYAFSHQISGAVYGLLKQSDNKVILYGNFTSIDGTTRNYIARLNADGTLDTTFDPNPNSYVTSAVLQSDGSVVLGGAFTTLAPNEGTTSVGRNYLARVTSAGAVDTAYNPNVNATVNALLLQPDGKVVAGGSFTTAQPNSSTIATGRNYIARFNTDGSLDTFDPNANNPVSSLALRSSDNAIVMGGAFTTVGGAAHTYLAVVNSSGAADATFTAKTNSMVSRITAGADGSILIAGTFTTVTPTGSTTPIARYHVARLTSTGTLDQNFNPDLAGDVTAVTIAPDGSVLVGGTFTSVQPTGVLLVGGSFGMIGGLAQQNVAELNGDGSVNANFQPNPDKAVNAVLPLPDGRFIVGGAFTTIAGVPRNGIARFNADGTFDTTFNPSISGGVTSLAIQDNGQILVGTSGASGLIRLNPDGSVDGGFQAAASFIPALAIAVQPDGKIIVGGPGSGTASRILRLNSDGSIDPTFSTVSFTGNDLKALTVQTDGSIVVAGSFTSIGGQQISNLARLTSSGAIDPSFAPAVNGPVTALALQSDGRLMIGGQFNSVTGLQRYSLARLTNTGSALQALGVSSDGKTITWVRRGTAGELAGVTFEKSLDLQTWVPANQVTAGDNTTGQGTRVGATSDWQLTNATIPTNVPVYIRARGIVPTSAGTSTGAYETIQRVDLASTATAAKTVAPVESTSLWDATHYVWTLDANGVMRIADAYTQATLAPSQTVLIDGSTHPTAASAARLADLSTRGRVTASSPLIGGFAVIGSSARPVLIRAVGPGLAPFSVTGFLKTPELVVYNSAGQVIATVKGWDSSLSAEFDRTGAFPLTPGSTDAAVLLTLQPGTYTVHVLDADGTGSPGGEALVEVYDGGDLSDASAHLANLSARATIAPYGTLIGGLYVNGSAPKTMLIRGIGPALTTYGVGGAISDPKISVYDAAGNLVVSNDNWQESSEPGVPSAGYGAAMSSAAASVGAFPFADGSKDAALVVTLPAGAYSVQVNGVNGASGAAMLEVYELP